MLKKIVYYYILLILIVLYSCKKTYETVPGNIVINELMPVNITTVTDQDGEYDDWIELYNLANVDIDLSGYFLSDSKKDLLKWKIPQGTSIGANGYVIVWADKDTTQTGLHANFKLSSLGEEVLLTRPDGTNTDKIIYPGQTLELSYSRVPNGKGPFKWQAPSFGRSNDTK